MPAASGRTPRIVLRWLDDAAASLDAPESLDDRLTSSERKQISSIRDPRRRQLAAFRRATLRQELAELLDTAPQDVRLDRRPCPICQGPHGRPFAVGGDVEFSVSSSRDVVALALHDEPVGVDIEHLANPDVVSGVFTSLHPKEQAAIGGAPNPDRAFTQIWARKEAFLKATGEGVAAPLSRDNMTALPGRFRRRHHPTWADVDTGRPDVFAAWATLGG